MPFAAIKLFQYFSYPFIITLAKGLKIPYKQLVVSENISQ
jgi:hypothetical protein